MLHYKQVGFANFKQEKYFLFDDGLQQMASLPLSTLHAIKIIKTKMRSKCL